MKTKKNWFPILLGFFVILFFKVQLMAVPYLVKENNPIDFEKLSKKEIEKKLGRKLKRKEEKRSSYPSNKSRKLSLNKNQKRKIKNLKRKERLHF